MITLETMKMIRNVTYQLKKTQTMFCDHHLTIDF